MYRNCKFSALFLAWILATCQVTTSTKSEQLEDKPNIILVMADDQGWGDMAYNDHPELKTPNFDALANEGLRFDRFYAAAPVCSPTRASVMTGRHPNRMGCFSWGHTLRPQEITLAEALRAEGYSTGHFGKWHLGSVRRGSAVNPGSSGFTEWLSAPNFYDNDAIMSRNGIAEQTKGESSMIAVDAAMEFIKREHASGSPYLAIIWFGSPHRPHMAIDEDRQHYLHLKDTTFQHFYGEITGMDRAFGKLRRMIRSLPRNDNTMIWYCSDNGGLPNHGTTGGRNYKGSIYEGGLRVPALMDWPKYIKDSRAISYPCNTSDIFPTILDVAKVNIHNRPLDGINLAGLIKSNEIPDNRSMGFWQYPCQGIRTPSIEWMAELHKAQSLGNLVGDSTRLRPEAGDLSIHYTSDSIIGHAAWIQWPWKLHSRSPRGESTSFELYHLEKDPMEGVDLYGIERDTASHLGTALLDWQKSVINSLNGHDY